MNKQFIVIYVSAEVYNKQIDNCLDMSLPVLGIYFRRNGNTNKRFRMFCDFIEMAYIKFMFHFIFYQVCIICMQTNVYIINENGNI
jgi:hypothetical protein